MDELTEIEKAWVFELYRKRIISKTSAINKLSRAEVLTAIENIQGAEQMLSGDTSRFLE